MRISDWSSDVCSSDLAILPHQRLGEIHPGRGNADEHLVGGRPRDRHVRDLEDVRPAAMRDADGFHAAGCASARCSTKIGRASCGERECQYEWISVGSVSLKKKTTTQKLPYV